MLTKDNLNIASCLLPTVKDGVNVKGLVPVPDTVLSEIVSASIPLHDNDNYDTFVGNVVGVTSNAQDTYSVHSNAIAAVVDQIAPSIRAHVAFARTVAAGLVTDAANVLSERYQTLTARPPHEDFAVMVLDIPAAMTHDGFTDLVSNSPTYSENDRFPVLHLNTRTREELIAMLMTGGKSMDAKIKEWVAGLSDDRLHRTWWTYFGSANGANSYPPNHVEYSDAFERMEICTLILLWVNHLQNNLPEDAKGMSHDQWQVFMRIMRAYAAMHIQAGSQSAAGMIRTRRLLVNEKVDRNAIRVVGPVYRDWLAAGGSVEVLLGMIVSGAVSANLNMIDAEAQKHMVAWRNYVAIASNNFEQNRRSMLATLTRNWYDLSLLSDQRVELEEEYLRGNPAYGELVKQQGNDYINNLSLEDFKDVACVALNLVARIRLGFTAAYPILNGIHTVRLQNPEIEVREAALVATSNYIFDYLAEQVRAV